MADERAKMCATCPHVGIANTDKYNTVELTYNGVRLDTIQPNHCHENEKVVCRGSVINIRHRNAGGKDCGDIVKYVMNTKVQGGEDVPVLERERLIAEHNHRLATEFADHPLTLPGESNES